MTDKMKAAYVSLYLTLIWGISLWAVWQLWTGENRLAWSGVLLTAAPVALGIGLMMIKPVIARTRANLPEAHVLILAGLALTAAGIWQSGNGMPALPAALSYLGFLLYVFWYSRYGRSSSESLQTGKRLPDFSLVDESGQAVPIHTLISKPSVLLFYRGNWCPLCMAQIREIAAQYQEITAMGADVLLISPQPEDNTRALAQRMKVAFRYLSDPGNQAARTLGIASEFGIPTGLEVLGYDTEAPMPTVIITDAEGRVIWADETDNYRVRPEPGVFLEVLRGLPEAQI